MNEINSIMAIAYRDVAKFLRDRGRILITFLFPVIFVGVLGGSLQANVGKDIGYNFILFTFIGVLGQTLFQSSASGVISLIEDREKDLSQEIFVSPISRYSIIVGKIIGESGVALLQAVGIIIFGLVIQVPMELWRLPLLIPFSIIVCILGGAFGIFVLSNLSSQRQANQIFPFIIFPQFFLAGVFNPIKELPLILDILSRLSPMRYAVDLLRGIYYWGAPEYDKVVLLSPSWNLVIIGGMVLAFVVIGTFRFVRSERNR